MNDIFDRRTNPDDFHMGDVVYYGTHHKNRKGSMVCLITYGRALTIFKILEERMPTYWRRWRVVCYLELL